MTDNSNNQLVVRAKFNFQQTNEDELSFAKGDVIHVTRVEEGFFLNESESRSVMSDSLQSHGILQARILEWIAIPFSRVQVWSSCFPMVPGPFQVS